MRCSNTSRRSLVRQTRASSSYRTQEAKENISWAYCDFKTSHRSVLRGGRSVGLFWVIRERWSICIRV
ncbi:hypothetical protein E2C01_068932 [Portunus trituberculatus]|uniref:Uncharacterized protein n=1 Tax=Portunus trituberculatus TaxID=210409 RepID=A0A5B7HY20_PORTR|nr:hypothetical protein [Portunus trituberculatus]